VTRALLVALAALLLLTAAAPQVDLADIEDEVMCDTCNVALYIAESPRADQQREEIRDLIAQGLTKQQILDTLEERYGPAILAMPRRDGFSAAAYVVPVAVVAVLAAGLLLLVPRWRRRARGSAPVPAAAPPAEEPTPEEVRRLDEELARFGP
jgi:cytochrome c-type biogenesis protein CcmH